MFSNRLVSNRLFPILLAGAVLLAAGLSAAQDLDVTIFEQGGDGQAAECWLGAVSGLDPRGDGFLAVRSGPGSEYRKIDELYAGDQVIVYETRGKWLGVLYGHGDAVTQQDHGCGFVGTGKRPLPYAGDKGWVHSRYIEGLAG